MNAPMLVVGVMTALATTPASVFAQAKVFSGVYGGADVGRQNIIGGSLVDGMDVLAQDNLAVLSILGGFRYQIGTAVVIGADASIGFMDGDLRLSDPANELTIDYENSTQVTLGLIGGVVVGAAKDWLLFGYISEATRTFDVTIQQQDTMFRQQDEQGMLRYGVGIEKQLITRLHLRAMVGTGRADFGDRPTNIEVEREIELGAGILLQL